MTTAPEVLHVRLRRDGDGWPPFDYEEVPAERLTRDRYRLSSVPAFARRLAFGDIVRVEFYGEPAVAWIEEVLEPSGNSTVRVIVRRGAADSTVISAIRDLGVVAVPTPLDGLFAVNIPRDLDYARIRKRLLEYEASGEIDFEEGALSPHHDYGTLTPDL